LKVIKDRLAAGDFADGPPEGVLPFERASENVVNSNGSATSEVLENSAALASATKNSAVKDGVGLGTTSRTSAVTSLLEGPAAAAPEPRGGKRHPTGHKKGDPTPVKGAEEEIEVPEVALTLKELCEQSGLGQPEVAELEKFGLLTRRSMGHVEYYDEEALVVARLAAGFGRHGIEPRHLRMYKVSADREAGLFEQLITPLLKQRRAAAREEAVEMLEELAELADDLRAVMVRASLREYLGQP
jgi:hypothetical protein